METYLNDLSSSDKILYFLTITTLVLTLTFMIDTKMLMQLTVQQVVETKL